MASQGQDFGTMQYMVAVGARIMSGTLMTMNAKGAKIILGTLCALACLSAPPQQGRARSWSMHQGQASGARLAVAAGVVDQ